MTNVAEVDQKLKDILVVREYLDVFHEDISDFLPKKEIEFTIELVLGTGPISIALYRMLPLELAELKMRIEKLLEK